MQAAHDFEDKCMRYFPSNLDIKAMNEILKIFMEAWNNFPHHSLGGKSPNQMVEEYKK